MRRVAQRGTQRGCDSVGDRPPRHGLMRTMACGAWSAGLVWGTLVCMPNHAQACSPIAPPSVRLVSQTIPRDGLIVGVLSECGGCTTADLYVQRVDSGAAPISGRLIEVRAELASQGWFAFRPDQPLEAGARYKIHALHRENEHHTDGVLFDVTALDMMPTKTGGSYRAERVGRDAVACATYNGSIGGQCTAPVFYEASDLVATLQVMASGLDATQLAYRVVWSADDQRVAEERRVVGTSLSHTFQGTPDSVCYELFGLPVLTQGEERRLGGECFSTAKDQLGEQPGFYGNRAETLRSCLTPPRGHEKAWCDAVSRLRASEREVDADAYAECKTAPNEDTGADAEHDGDADALSSERSNPDGCSVRSNRVGSLAVLGWGAVVMFVLRRRRSLRAARGR